MESYSLHRLCYMCLYYNLCSMWYLLGFLNMIKHIEGKNKSHHYKLYKSFFSCNTGNRIALKIVCNLSYYNL